MPLIFAAEIFHQYKQTSDLATHKREDEAVLHHLIKHDSADTDDESLPMELSSTDAELSDEQEDKVIKLCFSDIFHHDRLFEALLNNLISKNSPYMTLVNRVAVYCPSSSKLNLAALVVCLSPAQGRRRNEQHQNESSSHGRKHAAFEQREIMQRLEGLVVSSQQPQLGSAPFDSSTPPAPEE